MTPKDDDERILPLGLQTTWGIKFKEMTEAARQNTAEWRELERKAKALDFLLAHRWWMADQMPEFRNLSAEEALEEIEAAIEAEKGNEP